jgi:hypothetical protein
VEELQRRFFDWESVSDRRALVVVQRLLAESPLDSFLVAVAES